MTQDRGVDLSRGSECFQGINLVIQYTSKMGCKLIILKVFFCYFLIGSSLLISLLTTPKKIVIPFDIWEFIFHVRLLFRPNLFLFRCAPFLLTSL